MKESVFLTGATGLLGRNFLEGILEDGHRVYFTSRSLEKIKQIENSYNSSGNILVRGICVDFTSSNWREEIISVTGEIEPITILINNARSLDTLKVTNGETDISDFCGELKLGVLVPYELTKIILKSKAGSLRKIINISSIYGMVPPRNSLYDDGYNSSPVQYGVSKAGLLHLTKELSVRLASRGISVNAVSYGGVEGRANTAFKERYAAATPIQRMVKATEVAGAVRFLISSNSDGMTGQNIVVDGGYTTW